MIYAEPGSWRWRLRIKRMVKEKKAPNWVLGLRTVLYLYEVVSYSVITDTFTVKIWSDKSEPEMGKAKSYGYLTFYKLGAIESSKDIGFLIDIYTRRKIK